MRKGILYAILLLTLTTLIVNNAYAWTTWPSEDCNTWTEINTDGFIISQSGCYRLVTTVNNLSIDVSIPIDANVIIDLNGNDVTTWFSSDGMPNVLEVYNGSINSGTLRARYVYIHDFNSIAYISTYDSIYVTIDSSSFASLYAQLHSVYTTSYVKISNTSISGESYFTGMSSVELNSVTFGCGLVVLDSNTISVTSSTYCGYPFVVVNTPADINTDNTAYVLNTPLGTFGSTLQYVPILVINGDTQVGLDAAGSYVRILSTYNAYGSLSNITTERIVSFNVTGTLQNVDIRACDSFVISSTANIVSSNIFCGLGAAYWYNGSTITDSNIGAYNISAYANTTSAGYAANIITTTYMYLYPAYDANGLQTTFEVNASALLANTLYGGNYIYVYPSGDGFTANTSDVFFNVQNIGDQNNPVVLSLYGGADGVTYHFVGTKIYGTITCGPNVALVFDNADISNATIDPSCTSVSGITPQCVEINTNTYTITQPGCYVLTTDVSQITVDNTTQYDGNIEVDLNGHTLGKLYPSNIINNWPADTYVYNGTYSNTGIISANLGGHTFKMSDVNVTGLGNFLGLFGDGTVILENVYAPNAVIYLPNGPGAELNNVHALGIKLTTSYPVKLVNVSFTDHALIRTTSATALYMQDVNLPEISAVGAGPGGASISNVYLNGVTPIEIAPATVAPGGAYFYFNPQDWTSTTYVHYLDFLYQGSGIVSNVNTDYLGLGYTVYEIRDSNIGYLTLAEASFVEVPDFYNTYVGNMNYGIPTKYATTWNVIDSNIFVPNLEAFVQEMNLTGSELRFDRIMFYNDVNIIGGYMNAQVSYQGIDTSYATDPNTIRFVGTKIGAAQGTFYMRLNNNWSNVVFDGAIIGTPGDTLTISIYNMYQDATVVFDSVTVPADSVLIQCSGTAPVTVVFEGTTPFNKFTVSGCNVENNTIKPNLYITTSQTYQEVEEGQSVEFNVVVTAYGAPVDNVVVRAFADNYYNQFDQNAEYVIPHIDANQSVTVTFEFNLSSSPATYRLYAVVDPDDAIDESDETDNSTRDTTGTYFYVNVVRYISSCGTLYTGQYRLTTHIADANEDCFFVPNGEIVTLLAGAGVEASNEWVTVVRNEGQVTINGMWGTGKIYNSGSGVMYLYNVIPYTAKGFIVWNDGTLHVARNNDILIQFQSGGTVYLDGPDSTLRGYLPLDFGATMQLIASGSVVYNGIDTMYTPAPIYSDSIITDSNGAYIFLNVSPTFDTGVDEALLIITGNGVDTNISNKTVHSLKVLGSADKVTHVTLDNVTIDNQLHVESQGGMLPIEADIRNSTITPSYRVFLGAVSANIISTTINTSSMYVDGRANPVELNISNSTIRADTMSFGGTVKLNFDLTSAPSEFRVSTYIQFADTNIDITCVGDNWLYLDDYLIQNASIDAACLYNIDYNRNLWVEFLDTNISVAPDTNYSVTIRVHNDAYYTDVNTEVVLYIDGVEYKRTQVFVPKGSYVDITFSVHSPIDVGAHDLLVVVDPSNTVLESNESDNEATATVNVETQQAPESTPAIVTAAGGSGLSASNVLYVSAKVGEEKETAIHVSWVYGYETEATLTYVNINGEIIGPEKVVLRTGDNVIPIKVKIQDYGEVGKVIIYAQGKKQTVTIYARPLAQLEVPTQSALVLVLLAVVAYLLAGYFGWI